jgi:uncharacterized membrane protein YkvA (DUF1232 family)
MGLRQLAERFKRELSIYQKVLKHPATPWLPKLLLGLAVAYLLMPFDLIPDFIPVLGQLDELVVIPVLVWLAVKLIPAGIIQECRLQVESEHDGHC